MSKRGFWGSFGGDKSKEEAKKWRRKAMEAYMNRPESSTGALSSGHGQPAAVGHGQPAEVGHGQSTPPESSTSSFAVSPSGHGQPAAAGQGQPAAVVLSERAQQLRSGGAVIPANAQRAASLPTGTARDHEPMDHRLCRTAFRDQLVRAVRHGVMALLTAYRTQSLRKPPGSDSGPAREGAALARPKPNQEFNAANEAADAGHLNYHIVFRSLIFVADIVRELQREGIATDVEVHIPETYRYYGENTAEDTIEAALACAGSTWDTPGMVRPREGPRDKVSLAGDHLLQLISKTADCIKACWPEGATRADADLVARAFMDTSENPARGAAVVCPAGLTFGSAASAGLEPVTVHSAPLRPG